MKKYSVDVCRIGYAYATIEVEAENETDAMELAVEQAGDYEFSEKDAEYSAEFVTLA